MSPYLQHVHPDSDFAQHTLPQIIKNSDSNYPKIKMLLNSSNNARISAKAGNQQEIVNDYSYEQNDYDDDQVKIADFEE